MGALHAGHASLIDAVRAAGADSIAVTVFVNPLQFGPQEDFSRYPRTFEQDLTLCEQHGTHVVYAPEPSAMYPDGFQSHVEVERLTQAFEGEARPTHFRGVTTVVLKLLNATGPCVAAFGRKDYQQWRVIDRMVKDLDVPVAVLGCPIVREPDGLALSSRNRYLDEEQRVRAVAISRGLRAADGAYLGGERDPSRLLALAREPIEASFDAIDYVALVDAASLERCGTSVVRPAALLVAARLGSTRLIDNTVLGEDFAGV
jgi:pantoate--beta-alanine ligase